MPSFDGKSQQLYRKARSIIPGGTQLLSKRPEMFAPEQWPAYFSSASGCEVTDLDGRPYLDFTHNGVGSCLLGYAYPDVVNAVVQRVHRGSMSTLNSPEEVWLAEKLLALHPWAEKVRFGRCGGEAMAMAVRVARAATGRELIAFCGYHGWSDWYLAANLGEQHSLDGHLLPGLSPAGIPRGLHGTATPFTYNRPEEIRQIVKAQGHRLAAVVMEPTRNFPPASGFLQTVRELCDECGSMLVFDEVTTGFRFRVGGIHLDYGVEPDMAVFAKALGNGHPIAAIIGKKNPMESVQSTFMSSTYWTEGVGPAAALAVIDVCERINVCAHIRDIGERFQTIWKKIADRHRLPVTVSGYPALSSLSFQHPANAALMTMLTVRMLHRGFLVGSGFYPTLSHTLEHLEQYEAAVDSVCAELKEAIDGEEKEPGYIESRVGGPVKHSGFARLT